jgi:type II secretory pathway pseudopilin PulG
MKETGRPRGEHRAGFTLIELVVLIVVLSIGGALLAAMFAGALRALASDRDIQTATQLAQEKAETVLADRRARGYAYVTAANYPVEGSVAGFPSFARQVSITDPYSGTACPSGASCKLAVVTVSKGGASLARVSFMLAAY